MSFLFELGIIHIFDHLLYFDFVFSGSGNILSASLLLADYEGIDTFFENAYQRIFRLFVQLLLFQHL